jgi:hypothetical protein
MSDGRTDTTGCRHPLPEQGRSGVLVTWCHQSHNRVNVTCDIIDRELAETVHGCTKAAHLAVRKKGRPVGRPSELLNDKAFPGHDPLHHP